MSTTRHRRPAPGQRPAQAFAATQSAGRATESVFTNGRQLESACERAITAPGGARGLGMRAVRPAGELGSRKCESTKSVAVMDEITAGPRIARGAGNRRSCIGRCRWSRPIGRDHPGALRGASSRRSKASLTSSRGSRVPALASQTSRAARVALHAARATTRARRSVAESVFSAAATASAMTSS